MYNEFNISIWHYKLLTLQGRNIISMYIFSMGIFGASVNMPSLIICWLAVQLKLGFDFKLHYCLSFSMRIKSVPPMLCNALEVAYSACHQLNTTKTLCESILCLSHGRHSARYRSL